MTETITLPTTPPRYDEQPADGPAGPARPGLVRRLLRDTAYLASGLVLGVIGFCVTVTGLAAGLGLLVVWVGLAVLVGTVLLSRGLAHVHRLQLGRLQDRPAALPTYLVAPAAAGSVRRLLTPLRDPQSWLDVIWGVAGGGVETTLAVLE